MYRLLPLLLLSGCQLYMGAAVYDKSFDSEFKQERLLTTIGASQDMTENIEVFIEHTSQPTYEEEGYGISKAGVKLKVKL